MTAPQPSEHGSPSAPHTSPVGVPPTAPTHGTHAARRTSRRRSPRPPRRLSARSAGELIAAVPVLLGFVPSESLVVLAVEGAQRDQVGGVMRADLEYAPRTGAIAVEQPSGSGGNRPEFAMGAAVDDIVGICGRQAIPAAVAVIVERSGDPAHHRALAEQLRSRLARCGTDVIEVFATDAIAAGGTWSTVAAPVMAGTIPDPRGSLVAAESVFGGRVIRASREEYEQLLKPRPVWQRELVAAEMDKQFHTVAREQARKGPKFLRQELEHVLEQISQLASGAVLVGPELARLGLALSHKLIRDSVAALALTDSAPDAEALWLHLARELPDPERAEAACLVGFGAYVRGEGAYAAVAFEHALNSNPVHKLTGMLQHALRHGLRPENVQETAEPGWEIARELGVALPPRTRHWPR